MVKKQMGITLLPHSHFLILIVGLDFSYLKITE